MLCVGLLHFSSSFHNYQIHKSFKIFHNIAFLLLWVDVFGGVLIPSFMERFRMCSTTVHPLSAGEGVGPRPAGIQAFSTLLL